MRIRPRDRDNEKPTYALGSGLFTLKVYHCGSFQENENKEKVYKGGVVDYVDNCHVDKFTLEKLDLLCKILGHKRVTECLYYVEGGCGRKYLMTILSETDVSIMCECGAMQGETEVFVVNEHGSIRMFPCQGKLRKRSSGTKTKGDSGHVGGCIEESVVQQVVESDSHVGTSNGTKRRLKSRDSDVKRLEPELEPGPEEEHNLEDIGEDEEQYISTEYIDSAEETPFYESDFDHSDDDLKIWSSMQKRGPGLAGRSTQATCAATVDGIAEQQLIGQNSKAKRQVQQDQEPLQLFAEGNIEVDRDEDEYDSNELLTQSSSESEDEQTCGERVVQERFRPEIDLSNPKFKVGLIFSSKEQIKEDVRQHKVKLGKFIKVGRSNHDRIEVYCTGKRCKWSFYAARIRDSTDWQIKTVIEKHRCTRSSDAKIITPKFLAKKYIDDFRTNKGVEPREFIEKVHRDFNYNISVWTVYRTRRIAMDMIEGKYRDQYAKLWDFVEELRSADPNNTVVLKTEIDSKGNERFHRFYMCLGGLNEGFFSGCMNVLGLDGCHLRGPHPGILLSAVGLDPNNSLYPVAIAAVEIENKETWSWFIELLVEDLRISEQEIWTLMSDRQKGLIPAIEELLPNVEHRHCVRHLHQNFRKQFAGNALKEQLWRCATSTHPNQFLDHMAVLKALDEDAHDWLVRNCDPKHWSRAYFRTFTQCDMLLNNLCESFNATIMHARSKPILGLLECIRTYLMIRNEVKREWIKKQEGTVCPKVQKYIEKLKENSAAFIPRGAGSKKYQVEGMWGEQYSVDLEARTCACRKWEICGIPCVHAMSAIACRGEEVEDYVSEAYHTSTFAKVYQHVINPISGPILWPRTGKTNIMPPKRLKLPGRPKKLRRRDPVEDVTSTVGQKKLSRAGRVQCKCRKCGEKGHNARKCPTRNTEAVGDRDAATVESVFEASNINKCRKCGEFGHNRRTCRNETQNTDRNSVTQGEDVDENAENVDES